MNRRVYLPLIPLILCCLFYPTIAQEAAKTVSAKQETDSCQNQKLNLTGSYTGVLFTDKNQKGGTPATITVKPDNTFELKSESVQGSGLISGVNSCGDVSIALTFKQATGADDVAVVDDLLRTTVSLDVRIAGGGEWNRYGDKIAGTNKPVVLATSQDRLGKLAGADIAFVMCPDYPKCQKYPHCPCPEPPKSP